MEPASQQLIHRLERLGLNPQRDLQDCKTIVRRLSRDLPTFDSVWIDALVQLRRLTPFQARQLETSTGQELRIGPVVLNHPLEPGEHCRTFLAKHLNKSEPCVIKLLKHADLPHNVFDQLEQVAAKLRSIAHPSIIGPHACLHEGEHIVTVSKNAVGRTVHELMVRRGRFSPSVVAEIGRQLVDGLAALEAKTGCHGDICMANLRLNDRGAATLVDTGVRPIIESNPDLHSELPLRKLEGLAPERIGTGKPANSRSDLYSLGCLLWRLLCGRPVFLTADPLALIAAHRSKDIVDVREWSPDTPAWLAEFIRHATRRDPVGRPANFAAVAKNWGKPRRSGRRKLKQFQASFNRAPASTKPSGRTIPFAAAGILAAAGAAFMMHSGRMPQLLNLSRSNPESAAVSSADEIKTAETPVAAKDIRPSLPKPDANGQIVLSSGTTYPARNINFAGHLQISGEGSGATIVIDSDSMQLAAAEVSLVGIRFVDKRRSPVSPAIQIQSQSLTMTSTSYRSPNTPDSNGTSAYSWQAEFRQDRSSGRIAIQDCSIIGTATAIDFVDAPTVVVCNNTLKAGQGPLLKFRQLPQIGHECQLTIRDSTLRETGALIQLHADASGRYGSIVVRQANCVFALKAGRSLVETYAEAINTNQQIVQIAVERSSEPSLIRAGTPDATWLNPKTRKTEPMPAGTVRISDLATTNLSFAPTGSIIERCQVKDFAAPRQSTKPPGIDAKRFNRGQPE